MRLLLLVATLVPLAAHAETALPTPLRVDQVVALARDRRSEVLASRARVRAAAERPTIVSALEEPIVSASIDHLPFALHGLDASLTVEQALPLSRVRGHRQRAAEADVRRERANGDRVGLDVELDAAAAFWMLAQVRANAQITKLQHALRLETKRPMPEIEYEDDPLRHAHHGLHWIHPLVPLIANACARRASTDAGAQARISSTRSRPMSAPARSCRSASEELP